MVIEASSFNELDELELNEGVSEIDCPQQTSKLLDCELFLVDSSDFDETGTIECRRCGRYDFAPPSFKKEEANPHKNDDDTL